MMPLKTQLSQSKSSSIYPQKRLRIASSSTNNIYKQPLLVNNDDQHHNIEDNKENKVVSFRESALCETIGDRRTPPSGGKKNSRGSEESLPPIGSNIPSRNDSEISYEEDPRTPPLHGAGRPPPDDPNEGHASDSEFVRQSYLESAKRALASYESSLYSACSECSELDRQSSAYNSWRQTRASGWLTSGGGNSTDRSSVYSWDEDEFDKQATRRVASMFEEVDKVLFDRLKSEHASLETECREWTRIFKYLRVLGNGVATESRDSLLTCTPAANSQSANSSLRDAAAAGNRSSIRDAAAGGSSIRDAGNEYSSRPSTGSTQYEYDREYTPSSVESNTISVSGSAMRVLTVTTPTTSFDDFHFSTSPGPLDCFVEETFCEDGEIEEIIAYDNQELSTESELEHKFHVPKKKKSGYPPVTPYACTRDSTLNTVILHLWPEVVKSIQGYLHVRLAAIRAAMSLNNSTSKYGNDSHDVNGFDFNVSHNSSQVRLNTAGSTSNDTGFNLNELLWIGRKKLTDRIRDDFTNSSSNFNSKSTAKPATRSLLNNENIKTRYPSGKHSGNIRLNPIARNTKRNSSIIPSQVSSVIKESISEDLTRDIMVRRILPVSSNQNEARIMTPPMTKNGVYRHTALPPIESVLEESKGRGISKNSRVFSARQDEVNLRKALRLPHKENVYIDYSRPSTTTDFRDDPIGFSPAAVKQFHLSGGGGGGGGGISISPLVTNQRARGQTSGGGGGGGAIQSGIKGIQMALNMREDSCLSDEHLHHHSEQGDSRPSSRQPRSHPKNSGAGGGGGTAR